MIRGGGGSDCGRVRPPDFFGPPAGRDASNVGFLGLKAVHSKALTRETEAGPNENMTTDQLDMTRLPRHVAIIMDGNGRWAQARGRKRLDGHRAGADSVRAVTEASRELGLDYLTLYAFSEENWQRPRTEVDGLMTLLARYIKKELRELLDNGIRFNVIGDVDRLPRSNRKLIDQAMAETASNRDMVFSVALSYGGRQEILRACRRFALDCQNGLAEPNGLTEEAFGARLYTAGLPDPDLLIRTGGEQRVSNFLLWQIAYAELYLTETYWPDFREPELRAALIDFQRRQRRFGRTGAQVDAEAAR